MPAISLSNAVKAEITQTGILRFTNADGTFADLALPIRSGADGTTPSFIPGSVTALPTGSGLSIVTRSVANRSNVYQIDFGIPVLSSGGSGGGAAGRGIVSIVANGDGTATVSYTDGTTSSLTLPAGPAGAAGAPGAPGTAASPSTSYTNSGRTGIAFPYPRTTLERDADDLYSIMNWIPAAYRTDIQNGAYTGDLRAFIANAISSGESIGLNPGVYPIASGGLAFPVGVLGQEFSGFRERNKATIQLLQGFDTSTQYVFKPSQYASMRNLTWDCYQPGRSNGTVPSSSAIVKYPWLLDVSGVTRGRFDNLTMQAAWDGIYAGGNAGGCNFGRIEDGCLNRGIYIENPLDFLTIETWESWVYGFGGTGLEIWSYVNPGSLQFMAADGLSVNSLNIWKKNVVVNNTSQLAASFGIVKLDSGNAQIKFLAGRTVIGTLNSLTDAGYPSVENAGGLVTIGQIDLKMADAANEPQSTLIKNTSGTMVIEGGTILHNSSYREAEVNAGLLIMDNVAFMGPAAKSKPLGRVFQTGGRLMLKNCAFSDDTGGGFAVYLTTNDAGHSVAGNYLGGRGIRQPASPAGHFSGNVGGSVTTF